MLQNLYQDKNALRIRTKPSSHKKFINLYEYGNQITMRCHMYDTIEDIEKEDWSSLAGAIPDQQYEWFQAVEHTIPQFTPRYIVIKENSAVKGIAGLNLESAYSMGDLDKYPLLKKILTTLFGSLTILESTAPHSTFSSFFLSEDKKAEEELFDGLKMLLKTEKVAAIALTTFYEKQPFQKYGYKEFSMSPNTCLTMEWDSFEDYLGSWKPKRRHSIASSLKKGEKKGLHIKYTKSFASYADQLYQLKKAVAIHNRNLGTILPSEFYRNCMQYLGEMGEMALCFKGNDLVAFNFSLNHEKVCTVKFVGLNYQYREAYYFLYANAVKRGIEKGYTKMYFGRGTYTFKERLGCKKLSILGYIKMKNPLLSLFIVPVLQLSGIAE